MEYETDQRQYDDAPRGYDDRDRSRSPRNGNGDGYRARSASPRDRDMDSRGPPPAGPPPNDDDDEAVRNSGSNLFVTGIHPRLSEEDVTALFEKYGPVEKCNIMRDPHTKESRGFGFVNMANTEAADAAKEGLQGEVHEGRTLSIEKARRAKPRTPTPGRYYGPPKNDFRGPPRGGRFSGGGGGRYGGGRYEDRYYDRRGYREDPYYSRGPAPSRSYGGGGGGGGRYEDRGYGRRDRYDDRAAGDRYGGGSGSGGGGRDDRYGRGPPPSRDYYERDSRRGPPPYADPQPPRDYGDRTY